MAPSGRIALRITRPADAGGCRRPVRVPGLLRSGGSVEALTPFPDASGAEEDDRGDHRHRTQRGCLVLRCSEDADAAQRPDLHERLSDDPYQGYAYAYPRAHFILSARDVLPIREPVTEVPRLVRLTAIDYIACWQECPATPGFVPVWRSSDGMLLARR